MNKKQFTECVNDLWEEMRRLADHAEQIIHMELEKHGDMSKEFLFGDDEDFDKVWIDDERWLTKIGQNSEYDIIIGLEGQDTEETEVYLMDMSYIDRIEIADYLCRR